MNENHVVVSIISRQDGMQENIMKGCFYWMRNKKYALLIVMMACLPLNGYAASVEENLSRAAKWNQFAASLQTLSNHLIKIADVRREESTGGYGGLTADLEFYKEVKSYDKKSGKLISNVQLENKHPDRLHTIEVYIYDQTGHIKRDYTAAYLPVHRKAPYQTLINIHHHQDGLRGYRQFDASGDVLYEQCRGTYKNKEVFISLDDYEIPDHPGQIEDKFLRAAYSVCFEGMPSTAGPYLDPLQEVSLSGRN